MAPSGSADPYGLRRAASGIVQILLETETTLSLSELYDRTRQVLDLEVDDKILDDVLDFTVGRLRGILRDAGLAYDVVEAALAEQGNNPVRARCAAEQLATWVDREDWPVLLDNYARCVRITRDHPVYTLNSSVLEEGASRNLYRAFKEAESELDEHSDVDDLLNEFQPLVKPIQRFFDEVLVMAEDPEVRQARLALLQHIASLASGIADLSELEGF
jgi:glycyl-tRNA synthetase